ncbi:MAG: hypothetical protein ACJATX_000149 [Candidatus Paceibacteria bacterium]
MILGEAVFIENEVDAGAAIIGEELK